MCVVMAVQFRLFSPSTKVNPQQQSKYITEVQFLWNQLSRCYHDRREPESDHFLPMKFISNVSKCFSCDEDEMIGFAFVGFLIFRLSDCQANLFSNLNFLGLEFQRYSIVEFSAYILEPLLVSSPRREIRSQKGSEIETQGYFRAKRLSRMGIEAKA